MSRKFDIMIIVEIIGWPAIIIIAVHSFGQIFTHICFILDLYDAERFKAEILVQAISAFTVPLTNRFSASSEYSGYGWEL